LHQNRTVCRAIADQLLFTGNSRAQDHNSLRGIASTYIRNHAEEFSPFIGVEAADPEFEAYCEKVASLTDAEWGGQLEIKALSAALSVPILIYAADVPVLTMNDCDAPVDNPLRITYHKNYYALGEHYNSVTSVVK
jgi:OTU domain-containing protein 6